VLPERTPGGSLVYEHNKAEHHIHLLGGGDIDYFGFDDESRLGSFNAGAIGIDEAIELHEDEYLMLLGGLRNNAADPLQVFMASNPGPKSHFLYERFQPDRVEKRAKNRHYIHAATTDNFYLPREYVEALSSMPPAFRERYFLGKWGAFEGIIYQEFDPKVHVKERPTKEMVEWFGGVDAGYSCPFVFLVVGRDIDGRFHVFDEVYKKGMSEFQYTQASVDVANAYGAVDLVFCDPSAASVKAALKEANLTAKNAYNDVLSGIAKTQRRFAVVDGSPGLTVSPRCKMLISELSGYRWDKEKDKPVKEDDHACDALRYVVSSLDKRPLDVWEGREQEPRGEEKEEEGEPPRTEVEKQEKRELVLAGRGNAVEPWLSPSNPLVWSGEQDD